MATINKRTTPTTYEEEQRAEHATVCTFIPSNGRYFDRCRETADWTEVAYTDKDGRQHFGDYPTRRCDRHRKVDERTRARRVWFDAREYVPFNAQEAWDDAVRVVREANAADDERFWAEARSLVRRRDIESLRALVGK